jgi:CDP-diglyceride synthetase
MGDAYAYGHLATAAFSLAMAIAFAGLAWRVPAYRADFAYAVSALLCAGTGLAAMFLALSPSLVRARALFSIAVALYVSVPILWHLQFAADVWHPARRRRHRWLLIAYAACGVLLVALVQSGALDGGAFRRFRVGPLESGLMVLPGWAAVGIFGFACAIIPLSARLLGADGPRTIERRSALPLMLIAPPLCAHELLIAAEVIDMVPLGGYVAGLASLQGIVILTVRFRAFNEPRRLGPYLIERRLGSGGMADVYLAHRRGEGPLAGVVQPVAVKRLRRGLARDPEPVARLIEEARVLARLSHPNIVSMLDAGVDQGDVYLALELVEGATIAELLERARGGPPLGRLLAIEVGAQVAAALAHAHPAGLIHRDVSPENLLVDQNGTVKLTDFGLARALDRARTRTAMVQGKLPYVAPEQLRGGDYDHRVDLHALGALLHVVACGQDPYRGESEAELMFRLLEGRRAGADRLRRDAGDALADLIDRLLATAPADRPPDAAAVLAALAPLRQEEAGRRQLSALVEAHRAAPAAAAAPAPPRTRRLGPPSTPG